MSRIFISYKRVDKDKVFKIKDQIESALGEKCWIDLDGIESDAQFIDIIIKAIDSCEIVLFMYSKTHAVIKDYNDDWTIRELHYAQVKGKRIVIIRIDKTPLCGWFEFMFGLKQQIDISKDAEQERLLKDLKVWLNSEKEESLFDKGRKLYDEEKFSEAIKLLEEAYEDGILDACKYIGECYRCLDDNKSAIQWYIRGYEHGDEQIIDDIEFLLILTESKEERQIIEDFYLKQSEKGISRFYVPLGDCYFKANNLKSAYGWYFKAAELGDPIAQERVGHCLFSGWGVKKDRKSGFKWSLNAAEHGVAKAQTFVGDCYQYGWGVKKDEELAFEWYLKAAKQSDDEACLNVADFYEYGDVIEENPNKAFEWSLQAAENGNITAQCRVASFYYEGYGTKKNNAKAVEWYSKAAESEDDEAIEWLNNHRDLVKRFNERKR